MSSSSPSFRDYAPDELRRLVAAASAFAGTFRDEFGLDLYLTWGTLLGAVREGGFIAHDRDVDLAYLSAATTQHEVVEEHELIVRVLVARGYVVRPRSRGQMHVRVGSAQDERAAFDLDLWTTWIDGDRFFHYPDVKGDLAATAIVPLAPVSLAGVTFLGPAAPGELLQAFYGPDWRRPDPDYAWYPRYHSEDVFEFLRAPRAAGAVPTRPRRVAGLVSEESGDYFVVRAPTCVEPQRLNATGMLILELCDGARQVPELVRDVQRLYVLSTAPEVAVLDFLAHAAASGLIEDA